MRIADVGNDIWVGDAEACDLRGADFAQVWHVWRPVSKDKELCACVRESRPSGRAIRYVENDPLDTLDVPLPTLAADAKKPGKLLIHCAGGVCRSATLALLAKAERGCDLDDAVAEVFAATWRAYGTAATFGARPLADIWRWYGRKPPWDSRPGMTTR